MLLPRYQGRAGGKVIEGIQGMGPDGIRKRAEGGGKEHLSGCEGGISKHRSRLCADCSRFTFMTQLASKLVSRGEHAIADLVQKNTKPAVKRADGAGGTGIEPATCGF